MEWELSGDRTKLTAQISLKGDASPLKLRKSILPITLDSRTDTRQIKFAAENQKWWCLLNHVMYNQRIKKNLVIALPPIDGI